VDRGGFAEVRFPNEIVCKRRGRKMTGVNVAVVNATTVLTDEQVNAAGSELWDCMQKGNAPEWAADARLVFVPRGAVLPPCAWALVIMDDVKQACSLVNAESLWTAPM
jgi:hypothetical protein